MELNNLIYTGAKFVCEKIGAPFEDHKQKVKTYDNEQEYLNGILRNIRTKLKKRGN